MKRSHPVSALIRCVLAAAAASSACGAAGLASAAVGPGSISGVWQRVGAPNGAVTDEMLETPTEILTADGSPVPTQPWAAAIVKKRLQDAEAGHPYASTKTRCLPAGVPDFGAGPIQILETPGQITILRQEFNFFRVIHLGGVHPAEIDPGYLGHSVARWEGDTLIVDTIGLSIKTTLSGIVPHSEDLHVVERFHPTGPDTMDVQATIYDPKTFTRPWTLATRLHRIPGRMMEYFCDNQRNPADADGNTTVLMPAAGA